MSTEIEIRKINESDVEAFMRSAVERLVSLTGVPYSVVSLTVGGGRGVEWTTYVDKGSHVHGLSLGEAIDKQVGLMAPANRAATMREHAAELLKQAAELDSSAR